MDLNHHAFLASVYVAYFGDTITWSSDFEENFPVYVGLSRGNHQLRFFGIASSSASKIGLVLFTLCMSEIRAFISVERQAQSTFQRPKMVAKDVRILTAFYKVPA